MKGNVEESFLMRANDHPAVSLYKKYFYLNF